jgi:hypothetical protein
MKGQILQSELDVCESPDFWALTDKELAEVCRLIADGRCSRANSAVRGEAMRISLVWRDHLATLRAGDDAEERAAILAALRKRTIQILVKLMMAGPRAIRAR